MNILCLRVTHLCRMACLLKQCRVCFMCVSTVGVMVPLPVAIRPENIERVTAAVTLSPGRSARKHAREVTMSRESVRTILKKGLQFHPYKICVSQKLEERDSSQRQKFAFRMQVLLEDNENAVILMSDEAHFRLDGDVNRQNLPYWCSQNPVSFRKNIYTQS